MTQNIIRTKYTFLIVLVFIMAAGTALVFADGENSLKELQQRLQSVDVFLDVNVFLDNDDIDNKEFVLNWGEEAKILIQQWYPKLCSMLNSSDFQPVNKVELHFRKMEGVAWSHDNKIVVSINWITQHSDDKGMIVHELVHVVQQYKKPVPGWITEGIADYIRFFNFEKPAIPPLKLNSNYTDSYRVTAAFFNWIVVTYDNNFIYELNQVCRSGSYSDDFFKKRTKLSLKELWQKYHQFHYRGSIKKTQEK